jgi:hypothetical protein
MWLGFFGLRLRLACLCDRFGADHMLGAAERQEIAQFGRIDDQFRVEPHEARVVETYRNDLRDAIALGRRGDGFRSSMDRQPSEFDVRLQRALDHAERDARLERQPRALSPARS